MFWTNNYVSSPQVEALLSKQDFTLYELMDIDDIIQECKSQNKKLIEFITRPEIMVELVTLTTMEPPIELEERRRYKYPNVACELLTCDLPTINEKLAGDEVLLSKLYSFIDTDEPLNPLLASFFSRTIGVLVARASDQVLEFLKSRQRCVELLLHHLETSAIMDLLLKLVTQVEGNDMRQNILTWLDSQQLVQRLIALLSPEAGPSKHSNASQLICDMIAEGREYKINLTERPEPDPIVQRLESIETVTLLLKTILCGEKVESSILGGIQILLTLLTQKNKCGSSDADRGSSSSEEFVNNEQCHKVANAIIPFLDELNKLLVNPPHKSPVNTTFGMLEVPFGNTRLHVIKLFVTLLSTEKLGDKSSSCSSTIAKLMELGTFQILLDLFFKYSFNSFLHSQVQQFFQLAVDWNCPDINELVYENIFIKCKLLERIIDGWNECEGQITEKSGVKPAYMGHLIELANHLVQQNEKNTALNSFLKAKLSEETSTRWETFISEQLDKINKTQRIMLGGPAQVYSVDNSDVYHYSQEVYAQQVYSNYQEQLLGSQYISYSALDEKFFDGDEALHSNTVGQLSTIDFILNDDDLSKGEDMFSKICFQKRRSFGEDNGTINWVDGNDVNFQTVIGKEDGFSSKKSHDSSSSEEEEEEEDLCDMEVDTNEIGSNVVLPEVNPWEVASADSVEQTGWANFDSFESALNMESKMNSFVATFPDVIETPMSNISDEVINVQNLSLGSNSNDFNISGDEATLNASEANLPQLTKENPIHETTTCVDSVNTPDSNANPVTINRMPTTEEVEKNVKDIKETSVENLKPLMFESTTLQRKEVVEDIKQNSVENVKPLTDESTANVVKSAPVEDLVL